MVEAESFTYSSKIVFLYEQKTSIEAMGNAIFHVVGTEYAHEVKLIPLIVAGSFIVLSTSNIYFKMEWKMKIKTLALGLILATSVTAANAALYTNTYGTQLASESNCDDCFSGAHAFGAGQTINFFGNTYSGLFTGSNGYVTFGVGASTFTPQALNTQNIRPMIAGLFTDLDSRNDGASNVYLNDSTAGQLIITWQDMGHFSQNYGVRSTFQLVVRSDQFAVTGSEGQIGFFYNSITDSSSASAGFGDGLSAVNTGEEAFYNGAASGLSNSSPRWYMLSAGAPVSTVPVPAAAWLLGSGLLGLVGVARKRKAV